MEVKECESVRTVYKQEKEQLSLKSCKGLSYKVTKDEVSGKLLRHDQHSKGNINI